MNRAALRLVWLRFRATFRRRFAGYLALALLLALVGGLALGSLAAARRTQSSFPAFLAGTNPSDITAAILGGADDAALVRSIAALPHVKHVATGAFPNVSRLGPNGDPHRLSANVAMIGSVNGEYTTQDRVTVTSGRMADPRRAGEIMMNADAARLLHLRVGDVMPLGFYSNAQTQNPGFGTARVAPQIRVDARLVGIVVFNNDVVHDDIDRYPTLAVMTPMLSREIERCPTSCLAGYSLAGVQVDGGRRNVAAVERSLQGILPKGYPPEFRAASIVETEAERAIKPDSIALAVFGLIAALAALLIAAQVIGRQLRADAEELDTLRALGAGPGMTTCDGLFGAVGSVVVGSILAAVVAVGLSPLAPIGPVRSVESGHGVSFDWTVLGLGVVVLSVVSIGIAGVIAFRRAPHRATRSRRAAAPRNTTVARMTAALGLPASAVAGTRFALERGRGRNAVPVRSVLVGTALAVVIAISTITFGSSLDTLVSHPALYGWNWSYALQSQNNGPIPPSVRSALSHDAGVADWSSVDFIPLLRIDNVLVPGLQERANAAVAPAILSGHALDGPSEVVLGTATLAQLHKHVGDAVVASYGLRKDAPLWVPPTRLRIVGTATLPTVGIFVDQHTSMSTGALVSDVPGTAVFTKQQERDQGRFFGPPMVVVRLRKTTRPAVGLASLQRITDAANANPVMARNGWTIALLPVQRPAEIVNYRSMGSTPALLAVALAVGAIIALGLTLFASVRRRRRELALLKTLGFTRRQLAATVAWQATVAALVGTAFGVPLGVLAGRWLWILFAREISAVPEPTVGVLPVVLVALGTLALANVVAALPGRQAARTPTALLLHAE